MCSVKVNIEHILQEINRNFINIDDEREEYAKHFQELTKTIFRVLRENQKPFGTLFNGFQLGGSYGDNLKVTKPNEFDLVFHIRFPYNYLIIVHKDEIIAGNVHLNMTEVLRRISKEKHNELIYKNLQKWINDKNYLLVDKFQSYLYSCFHKTLSHMQNKITVNNVVATLTYKRCGPAHTIYINCNDDDKFKYSVDFVPGILLDKAQSISNVVEDKWEAIPKPIYNLHSSLASASFRASYYREEYKMLKNKNQLKNVLRMLKKFRDAHSNMQKMKSYFIKTIFLWKLHKQPNDNYWNSALCTLLIDMFQELEHSLNIGKLPFYWHPDLNLYNDYSQNLLQEMAACVRFARVVLINTQNGTIVPSNIHRCVQRIFLKTEECQSKITFQRCCQVPPTYGNENDENVNDADNKDCVEIASRINNSNCIIL